MSRSGSRCVSTETTSGSCSSIARSTWEATSCACSSVMSPGQLQVERDLVRGAEVDDADVVDLAYARHAQRRDRGELAERLLMGLGLDMDDHVALRQRTLNGGLDRVRGRVTLTDRGSGRHADHHVHEVTAGRLAHPQSLQVHRRIDPVDGRARRLGRVGRRAVHQHVDVPPHQAGGGHQDEAGDEERSRRVGLGVARGGEHQAEQHGDGARQIAPRSAVRSPQMPGCGTGVRPAPRRPHGWRPARSRARSRRRRTRSPRRRGGRSRTGSPALSRRSGG